jgi:diguanylate cyclase (GGDEF)-like protein
MDIATPEVSVEQAMADLANANGLATVINPDGEPIIRTLPGELPGKPHRAHQILSAIIGHHPLPSIMQMIAEAFVALCPSRAVAIFVLSGRQFDVAAEAGLPPRAARKLDPVAASESRAELAWSFPALRQILDSGVTLCFASPLVSSSGHARGAFTVFDLQPGILDDPARETIQSLCDFARLAIEHSQLFEEVLHQSQFDRLTGLPNRLLLEDRLRQAMIVAKRQGTLIGVCCIDLDHFRQINDSLGHELGDAFFKLVSERLNLSIRDIDTLARQSGDEFILALCDIAETLDATNICQRLLKDLSAPLLLDGHSLSITASIGISIFPDHGDSADLLLRNADIALQAVKRAGGCGVQSYSPALGKQTRRAEEMVGALVNALAQTQFRMVYQPIFTMDKEIVGFEALLRWKHPTWGQISPLEFIPTAERSGLIIAIGDWVIDEVCRQTKEWDAAAVRPVKMFANVSGVQLECPDFSSKIADTLARSGVAPDRLELEITESWIISDLPAAAAGLRKLRDLGIGVAIDDFGTGYATFNYLHELPLDTLKIDRSFIQCLDGSVANLSTVRAIATLAKQLGLKTVAEGVESEHHIRQLREIGCELMQGFFLSQPLKPEAACTLLRKQRRSSSRLRLDAERSLPGVSPTQCLTK